MKSNYKLLGNYIREVIELNTTLEIQNLRGISSVYKSLIESKANINGVDFKGYKIMRKGQFAYNPNTARMGDKIPIALNNENDCIVSKIYPVFEIIKKNELLPEYLMMWFRRAEFDRYARFMSHGSAREVFSWEEMSQVELPIPEIEVQKKIVIQYDIIIKKMKINEEKINVLVDFMQSIYKEWFVDLKGLLNENIELIYNEQVEKEIPESWKVLPLKMVCEKIGSGATPKGGKDVYGDSGISLIRSLNIYDFIFSMKDLAFINEEQGEKLKNVIIEKDDILLNITGVSVARCSKVLDYILPARVNQHVMIIRPKKDLNLTAYLLCLLCYEENKNRLLGLSQAGSTREALTKGDLEEFLVIIPDQRILIEFEKRMKKVFIEIENKIIQNKHLNEFRKIMLERLSIV